MSSQEYSEKSSVPHERIYLDTSAYLCVLLAEKGALAIVKNVRSKIICSSVLLVAETERNIVRMARAKIISQKTYEKVQRKLARDIDQFITRDLTSDICLSGQFPAIKTPKTADLLHIRTALWFKANGGLSKFISLDINQKIAALELGLEC